MPVTSCHAEPLSLPVVSKPLKSGEPAQETLPLVSRCGAGAYGDVYVGVVKVAVKVVERGPVGRKDSEHERESAAALQNEAWALKRCRQAKVPHVIQMMDYNTSLIGKFNKDDELVGVKHESAPKSGTKCNALVLEYASGGSLESRLKKGPMPEAEVCKLAKKMLEALEGLHYDANIVHRDIKAANVMFEGDDIRLIDFGVCAEDIRPKTPVGTPYYMAPEVWLASMDNPYTCRADLWSLGVLLYQASVGYFPFDGKSLLELQRRIQGHLAHPERLYFPRSVSLEQRDFILSLLSPAKSRPSAIAAQGHAWFSPKPIAVTVKRAKPLVHLPPLKVKMPLEPMPPGQMARLR